MQMPLAEPVQINPGQQADPAALQDSPAGTQAAAAPRGPGKPVCAVLAAGDAVAAAGAVEVARSLDGMTRCNQPQEDSVAANVKTAMR